MALTSKNDVVTYLDETGNPKAAPVVVAVPGPSKASGVTPVASEALVVNVRSSGLSPAAGRNAYAWLTGTGTASGFIIFSRDGANWFPLYVEGSILATFTYSKPATLGSQAFAGQLITIPVPDQTGLSIALIAAAVSGTVNVELTQ